MTRVLIMAGVVWLEMLRRKDVYVLLVLLLAFLIILMSLDIFGLGEVTTYVKDIGLLLAWLFAWILAVNVSARQLPQEEKQGTIFPLLAKPVGRGQVVLGKWLGAWSVASAATVVFYAILALIVAARGGRFGWLELAQGMALHFFLLGIIAALGIALSTRMHYDAAVSLTYLATLAAFLLLPRVPTLMLHAQGARRTGLLIVYYALPHLELFDMRRRLVYEWGPADSGTVAMVLVYGAMVTAMFLLLAWIGYRRKRLVRG